MKRKERIIAIVFVVLLLGCSLAAFASSKKELGGYAHQTANGEVDLLGYFATDGATKRLEDESIDFIMEDSQAAILFEKPLAADDFGLYFAGIAGNSLQKVEFVLTDADNPEESVMIAFSAMNEASSLVKVNEAKSSYIINGSLYVENTSDFYVHYNAEHQHFSDSLGYTIPVRNTVDGSLFSGFSSHKVTLKIQLYGEKGSVFRLTELNHQRLGNLYTIDTESPTITILNPVSKASINSVLTIPQALAMDVLAEHSIVTMRVLDPDKAEVKAVDGTKLTDVTVDKDYQIKIDKYGTYIVLYKATDGANMTPSYSYIINVQDNCKPEITLKGKMPLTVKVGDTLTFPEVTYSDNVTKAETIKSWITVKYPSGRIMDEKESITLEEEGVYEITYSATDEAGNVGRLTIKTYAEVDSYEN